MSTNETDTKPKDENGPSATINLKVATQDGNEIFFKCKLTTPLSKLMNAFCQRQGVTMQSVRFLFDGDRITAEQTPKDLDMVDGDSIDVMVQQTGGAR
ncbi:ubiquitin-related protein [Pavlovales sp. CCMP2436]|nr:ubiquitin-related protein [Pavlovales sp. CCMP2436]